MATISQRFYHSTTEQDFTAAGEVDIKKLLESAPGTNSTTVTTHANAAGTTQITLDPYTNRSATGDIRANAGWAVNRLGADGMESVADARRIIPAGAWVFTLNVALPVAGLTTGTLTVSFIAQVFRVSSSGARTALFTATSNTGQSTGLAALASTTLTATSAAQPQYVLEADETIHVGFLSNLVQVAGVAGATVSGVATWTVGTTTQYVQVPTPGVRTTRSRSLSDTITTVTDSLSRIQGSVRSMTESIPTTESIARQMTMSRTLTDTNVTTDTLARSVGLNRALTEDLATGGGGTTIIQNNIFTVLE